MATVSLVLVAVRHLSVGRMEHRPDHFPLEGEWFPDPRSERADRFRPDFPELYRTRFFSFPPVGRRKRA